MASSDLLDSHRPTEVAAPDLLGPQPPQAPDMKPAEFSQTETDTSETVLEKRVALPKPDTNNITVLTESLPNEPILPWHHFDSPWLEKEETPAEELPNEEPAPLSPDEGVEQLTLALEEVAMPDNAQSSHNGPTARPDSANG
ncbi:MAG: hypothetical protein RLZZ597_2696 [Cyanobacteriota bacterium]|jgi:hypothetical protein